jgi:hypothetical protein
MGAKSTNDQKLRQLMLFNVNDTSQQDVPKCSPMTNNNLEFGEASFNCRSSHPPDEVSGVVKRPRELSFNFPTPDAVEAYSNVLTGIMLRPWDDGRWATAERKFTLALHEEPLLTIKRLAAEPLNWNETGIQVVGIIVEIEKATRSSLQSATNREGIHAAMLEFAQLVDHTDPAALVSTHGLNAKSARVIAECIHAFFETAIPTSYAGKTSAPVS